MFIPLIVWADNEPIQNDPAARPDLHVGFRLSADGDAIGLYAPDGTEIDLLTFGPQAEDFSEGIPEADSTGDRGVLIIPTPGTANSAAPAAMNPSLAPTANDLALTVATTPGFTYALESSQNLLDWEPFGTAVVATSASLTFSFPLIETPRFFVRVVRSP